MHMKETARHVLSLALLAGVFAPATVRAEDWYLKTNNSDSQKYPFTTHASALWTNALGAAATATSFSGDSGSVAHVQDGKTIRFDTGTTFPGGTFCLGAVDGSSAGYINMRKSNFTVNNMQWYRGEISQGFGGSCPTIAGAIAVKGVAFTHSIKPNTSTAASGINFTAAFSCEDADINVPIQAKGNNVISLAGNNESYIGSFEHKGSTILLLRNNNALGNPSSVRSDALKITGANAVLGVAKDFAPNASRGISIGSTGLKIRSDVVSVGSGTVDCSAYELPMPISGSYGFTKTGDGTVTLSGAYTAGAITVSAGTLHLAASSSFPAAQAITVKAGAKLVVHNKTLQSFSITAEEGAVVEHVVDPIVVKYDPETKAVTTKVVSDLCLLDGEHQVLSLSELIALPFHDPLTLELLQITAGTRDYKLEDFVDATEKTYELPRTCLSVEKDEGGVQHVYLNARPVVKSVAEIGNVGINGVAASWSDSATPHKDADYLLVHKVGSVKKYDFEGDTLTIANSALLQFRYENSSGVGRFHTQTGEPVTIYPGCHTDQNYSGVSLSATGEIFLPGQFGDSDYLNAYLRYGKTAGNDGQFSVDATLSGAGTLQISGAKNGTSWNGIGGNNTNYFGRIIVTGNGTTVETRGTQCRVSKAEAFGGRLDEFQENALTLTGYAMIKATGNVALTNDMNRGIYIGAQGGFNCDAGKTFTCGWPIKLGAGGNIYKHGAGTLELGGAPDADRCRVEQAHRPRGHGLRAQRRGGRGAHADGDERLHGLRLAAFDRGQRLWECRADGRCRSEDQCRARRRERGERRKLQAADLHGRKRLWADGGFVRRPEGQGLRLHPRVGNG